MADENKEQITNDELRRLLEAKFDGFKADIMEQVNNGDESVRQYVDSQLQGLKEVIQHDFEKLTELFTEKIESSIGKAFAPVITEIAKFS